MHKKSKSTVEKWIYEKKGSPQFSDIFELYIYIYSAKIEMPRKLNNVYSRHYQRGYIRAKKYLSKV
jgi:hypothetical protein